YAEAQAVAGCGVGAACGLTGGLARLRFGCGRGRLGGSGLVGIVGAGGRHSLAGINGLARIEGFGVHRGWQDQHAPTEQRGCSACRQPEWASTRLVFPDAHFFLCLECLKSLPNRKAVWLTLYCQSTATTR